MVERALLPLWEFARLKSRTSIISFYGWLSFRKLFALSSWEETSFFHTWKSLPNAKEYLPLAFARLLSPIENCHLLMVASLWDSGFLHLSRHLMTFRRNRRLWKVAPLWTTIRWKRKTKKPKPYILALQQFLKASERLWWSLRQVSVLVLFVLPFHRIVVSSSATFQGLRVSEGSLIAFQMRKDPVSFLAQFILSEIRRLRNQLLPSRWTWVVRL